MSYFNPYSQFAEGNPEWANIAASAIGQLAPSLGSTASSNPYDFSTNNFAPLSGAAQGFLTGGPIGAAVGAIGGMLQRRESFRKAQDNLNAIPDNIDASTIDPATGRPVFNSRAAIEGTATMDNINSALRKKRKGFFRRAFASNDDKILQHQMGLKIGRLDQSLESERQDFNTNMQDFNAQQLAMTRYNKLRNNQDRLNNLYSIGTSLY